MRVGVRGRDEAAVVADVQPLVGVGGPGVGPVDPAHEMAATRRSRSPQPEGAVDVVPGVRMGRQAIRDRVEGVARAGVHVAGLAADDRGAIAVPERGRQRTGVHPALAIGRDADNPLPPEAEVLEGRLERRMRLGADQDADVRRAEQTATLDVPADALEDRVTSSRERDDVREARTAGQPEAGVGGKPQQVEHPVAGDLLGGSGGRRRRVEDRVLVPRRGQPVGAYRCRQRPPDDEAEEARPRRRHEAGLDRRRQDPFTLRPPIRHWCSPSTFSEGTVGF